MFIVVLHRPVIAAFPPFFSSQHPLARWCHSRSSFSLAHVCDTNAHSHTNTLIATYTIWDLLRFICVHLHILTAVYSVIFEIAACIHSHTLTQTCTNIHYKATYITTGTSGMHVDNNIHCFFLFVIFKMYIVILHLFMNSHMYKHLEGSWTCMYCTCLHTHIHINKHHITQP